jgi:hypothetical protein
MDAREEKIEKEQWTFADRKRNEIFRNSVTMG